MKNRLRLRIINSYLTSTISITFVLLLLGVFSLLLLNIRTLSAFAKESIIVSVLLKPNMEEFEILNFQKDLDSKKYCKETDFVTKERAAEELKTSIDQDFIEILGYNPLPESINIKLHAEYSNTDSIAIIEEQLSNNKIVSDVFYYKSLVHQVDTNIKNIGVIVSSVSFLLFLITITLINNTIRLEVYSKRFSIKTMQLVGATKRFILKPFIIKSFFHGAITSLLSISILMLFILYFQSNIYGLIPIKNIALVFLIVFLTGIIITVGATFISVLRYIETKIENLY